MSLDPNLNTYGKGLQRNANKNAYQHRVASFYEQMNNINGHY